MVGVGAEAGLQRKSTNGFHSTPIKQMDKELCQAPEWVEVIHPTNPSSFLLKCGLFNASLSSAGTENKNHL